MSESVESVIETIRNRVEPDPAERTALSAAIDDLLERVEAATSTLPVDTDIVLAGSTTRGTWLPGDRDIDIFVQFPPEIDREQLREYGLTVGHDVLPNGREEFAEHPYVVGEYQSFKVDIVPCFDVADATEIQSAVDRTPFHTEYIEDRIDSALASEIRICKQFLSSIGSYGSDLRTRGFSGFLTELLVLEYGGFRDCIEAVASWSPPVVIDPENHGATTFEDPLVVVDPTDPNRNVAAVCSATNVARVQHFARELLNRPRTALFEPPDRTTMDKSTVQSVFADRDTTPIALCLQVPAIVDDQLWPQLERSRTSIADALDRAGFPVLRSACFAEPERDVTAVETRQICLFFELAVGELPAIERHEGPPVHVREHAVSFYEEYAADDSYGPFLDDGRYVVERKRSITSARAFFEKDSIQTVSHGAAIEEALEDEYQVYDNAEVGDLAQRFGMQLTRYLDPSPYGR